MRRLIDADLLKKNCKCTGKFEDNFKCVDLITLCSVIDAQPTAYDVDLVVDQLETRLKNAKEKVNCGKGLLIKEPFTPYITAIEIVRGGGID